MVNAYQSASHSFLVTDIATRGVPTPTTVFNEFDYFGTLLGVERLSGERNASYKERLFNSYVNRANSTATGLIYGITRELGLSMFKPIEITVKSSIPADTYPRIDFINGVAYLWSDFYSKTLEMIIDCNDRTKPEYFVKGLIDKINTSLSFEGIAKDNSFLYFNSNSLIDQSNHLTTAETLKASAVNSLKKTLVNKGAVTIIDTYTYNQEVTSEALLKKPGQYFIDYPTGIIKSILTPVNNISIQYSYRQNLFEPIASPIVIKTLHSRESDLLMFNQQNHLNDLSTSLTPTIKGSEIINELISVIPEYWGK